MSRTAADLGMPMNAAWPPAGKHDCRCMKTERWQSPKAGTHAVRLYWATTDGKYSFDDPVFVTVKAMPRLNMVAQRVSGMPKETEIPDDDAAAMKFLARYVLDHSLGRFATVTIEEKEEEFMYENGPKMGTRGRRTKKCVAYAGYEVMEADVDSGEEEGGSASEPEEPNKPEDALPF